MCPFPNYAYASFPNLILFRLTNYLLVLIHDFTGLLKIKLIGSVCFHRVCPKILVFQALATTPKLTGLKTQPFKVPFE